MSQSYCNLIYHIVFSTKTHQSWLQDEIRARIHEYLGGAIRGEGGVALVVGGTSDHVHILAKLRQDHALSDVMRKAKAHSSGWMHKTFPELRKFGWQAGYGAFTVSQSVTDREGAPLCSRAGEASPKSVI